MQFDIDSSINQITLWFYYNSNESVPGFSFYLTTRKSFISVWKELVCEELYEPVSKARVHSKQHDFFLFYCYFYIKELFLDSFFTWENSKMFELYVKTERSDIYYKAKKITLLLFFSIIMQTKISRRWKTENVIIDSKGQLSNNVCYVCPVTSFLEIFLV